MRSIPEVNIDNLFTPSTRIEVEGALLTQTLLYRVPLDMPAEMDRWNTTLLPLPSLEGTRKGCRATRLTRNKDKDDDGECVGQHQQYLMGNS
jgi:hypothetical protein